MPKKSSVVSTTPAVETPAVVPSSQATEPKKKKVAVRKSVKKTVPKVEPVVEPVVEAVVEPEPVVEPAVEAVPEEKVDTLIEENSESLPEEPRRTKRVVNKFKVQTDWETFFTLYSEDIAGIKKKPNQKVNLQKFLTMIKNDTFRVLKLNRQERKGNKNSGGFMKPVKISDELASFIECTPEERDDINRTEITKRICKYIRENNLQRPDDRREIIPDETLKKLFALNDVPDEKDKLTYYSIQKKVQSHIFKI
jgi:chromatin remodeling complex protein RSC6